MSPRDRVVAVLRRWCAGEEWDRRLVDLMPEADREEYDRLARAVEEANQNWETDLAFWCEWLHQTDLMLAWLECLSAYQAREQVLLSALPVRRSKSKREVLPIRPVSPRGFVRDTPRMWGVS